MLIDWFTTAAQIVNFLVLMVLLKVFLYDRIVGAMDEREGKIKDRLEAAEKDRRDAEELQKRLQEQERKIDRMRDDILAEARESARAKREELEKEAREDVDELRERWTKALEKEKEAFVRRLREKAARQVVAVSRRVLKDMAGEDLQDRLVESFRNRVKGLSAEEKEALAGGVDDDRPSASVVSSLEFSTADRRKMTQLLREEIHPGLEVDYRTGEALLGGIEMRVPGKKVSWSLRGYLETLEDEVAAALAEIARQKDGPGDKSGESEAANEESGPR